MVGDQRAEIHRRRLPGITPGELRVDLGAHLVAATTDGGAKVHAQLTGRDPGRPATVDLRAVIADHARAAGVRHITISPCCTRCHVERYFSYRAGDLGRQISCILGPPEG